MITETIGSITIVLPETEGLFSPRGLDRGTRAMLELYPPEPGWRVLDLGSAQGRWASMPRKSAARRTR